MFWSLFFSTLLPYSYLKYDCNVCGIFSIVRGHERMATPANKAERNKNPAAQYNVLSLHLRVLENWEIHVHSLLFIRHKTNSYNIVHRTPTVLHKHDSVKRRCIEHNMVSCLWHAYIILILDACMSNVYYIVKSFFISIGRHLAYIQ